MELSPEDKQRIYQEEKARLEAEEKLREEKAKRQAEQSKKVGIGCLAVMLVIFVVIILSVVPTTCNPGGSRIGRIDSGGSSEGHDLSYAYGIIEHFYYVEQVEDLPGRKVWKGLVRKNSVNTCTVTASRLPNGKWDVDVKW